jgi:hypothetical protein
MERSLETLRRLDRGAPLLAILGFVLFLASVGVAPRGSRRTMVLVWGVTTLFSGIVLGILRSTMSDTVVESLTDQPTWQAAYAAVYENVTELLRLAGNAMVLVGVVAIAGAWYVGESRAAVATRDLTVPTLRHHTVVAWAGAALVAYLAFTRVPALESRQPLGTLLLLVLLAVGFAAIMREAKRLVPEDAPPGPARVAVGVLRARVTESVTGADRTPAVPAAAAAIVAPVLPAPSDVLERLDRLDDLHRRGVLDDTEFDAAKRMLLHTPAGRAPQPSTKVTDGGSDGHDAP